LPAEISPALSSKRADSSASQAGQRIVSNDLGNPADSTHSAGHLLANRDMILQLHVSCRLNAPGAGARGFAGRVLFASLTEPLAASRPFGNGPSRMIR